MARLIEVQDEQETLGCLTIQQGDAVTFSATGGRVLSGQESIEMLGPYVRAVIGDDGKVMTPMGPPNSVIFRANHPGTAHISLVIGDPFHSPKTLPWELTVTL
ncbi:MAG TPA: hypothetical protein VE988_23860 [Gemmataceae bacterium]|nr:hypothetical protein [Gemmataceae bacterium]